MKAISKYCVVVVLAFVSSHCISGQTPDFSWTKLAHTIQLMGHHHDNVEAALVNLKMMQAKLTFSETSNPIVASSWFGHLLEGKKDVIPAQENVSVACINATSNLLIAMVSRKIWALQALDATGKPPSGIMQGNLQWLGYFSECRELDVPAEPAAVLPLKAFKGQYCLGRIGNRSLVNSSQPGILDMPMSVGPAIGLCIPQECSAQDIQNLLNLAFDEVGTDYGIVTTDCQPDHIPLDTPAIGVICMLVIFGIIILAASLYDVLIYQPAQIKTKEGYFSIQNETSEESPLINHKVKTVQNPGLPLKILLAFSLPTNASKILSTKQTKESIGVLHGMRFISLTWVMLGHTIVFAFTNTENIVQGFNAAKHWSFQAIINAPVSVDSFFFLSGLLVAYLMLKALHNEESPWKRNWLIFYFHRFWRLTPSFLLLMGTYVALFKYWGSGPLWPSQGFDVACKTNWWRNMLYIQNFFPSAEMCMGWTWYLAVDMQFFIFSPLLVVPFTRSVHLGVLVNSVFLLITISATVALVVKNNFFYGMGALLSSLTSNPTTELENFNIWFEDVYIKPWCRMSPYLVGIITGVVLHKTDRKLEMPWVVAAAGWATATAIALAVLYGPIEVVKGHLMTTAGSAMYNSLHSLGWAVSLAWVVIACDSGYGGFVTKFLSWGAFIPLSRLTYMAYLIHPVLMYLCYLGRETPLFYSSINMSYFFLGHVAISYALAFIFTLAFESPLIGMERLIFKRSR